MAKFKTRYDLRKSLKVVKKLGIKVKWTTHRKPEDVRFNEEYESAGSWKSGKTIYLNPKLATNYTVLHEIGHTICGYMCCNEHCEYAAHGAALTLAKVFKIKLPPQPYSTIDVYSGRSKCPVENKRRKK